MKTSMRTLRLIRIIGATAATSAAVVTLAFAATLGQAARLPAIAWSPVTSPGTFDYGTVDVGDAESQAFALTNSGRSATGMLRVSLGGAAEFTITADACTGTALGPGKSCNVTVQYAPTTAGQTTAMFAANGIRPPASASIRLTGTGAVSRHIYWSNASAANGSIGRANLDGTGVNQSFITGTNHPVAVAVDSGHIYWTNSFSGTIGRANLDGTGVNQSFITGANNPTGLAVDSGHIYWANRNAFPATIGRANLDGTSVNQGFITLSTSSSLFAVAVDAEP
jgi:centrosomal CEP192-like protein/low-density lipoprotein receptor class B